MHSSDSRSQQDSATAESLAGALEHEKPANGLAGLKHWRHDLLAGVVVSLVSLPLSSGIAIASGAPPIYGLISAIIAGLIYPALGGSYVTISGPAAGLAPALVAIMASLGGAGDAHQVGAGYYKLLAVISIVGVVQIVLGTFKLAKYVAIFPAAVVEGMLAAIGLLILVKAVPLLAGVVEPGHPHGFVEYAALVPQWLGQGVRPALAVGLTTTVVMLLASSSTFRKERLFRYVPAHLWAVLVAVPLGAFVGLRAIDPALLISVPANPLSGLHLPAFGEIFSDPSTWKAAALGVVTLLLIDGVESIATAQAVDRIDPYRRTSDPDRVLLAMGVSNLASSLLGGLTVIPGGVKSKTNIEAGGRTLWSNFVNALMLLAFLFVAPGLISRIPTAALGGILVYTGWKMAHPSIARQLLKIGREQLLLYSVTLATTLLSDLLIGVAVGTLLKLILVLAYTQGSNAGTPRLGRLASFFRDPVHESIDESGVATLQVKGPLVCFNSYWLKQHLADVGKVAQRIRIELTQQVSIVDHTAAEVVQGAERYALGHPVEVEGLLEMPSLGGDTS
ncbi:MAG: SulP family inorganic anion transporter [Acidobacteriota bacterium]